MHRLNYGWIERSQEVYLIVSASCPPYAPFPIEFLFTMRHPKSLLNAENRKEQIGWFSFCLTLSLFLSLSYLETCNAWFLSLKKGAKSLNMRCVCASQDSINICYKRMGGWTNGQIVPLIKDGVRTDAGGWQNDSDIFKKNDRRMEAEALTDRLFHNGVPKHLLFFRCYEAPL